MLEEGAGSFKGTAASRLGKLSLFPSTSKEGSLSLLILCASPTTAEFQLAFSLYSA